MRNALEKKSVEELIILQAELETMITEKKKQKKAELRNQFKEMAEKAGMSVNEIFNTRSAVRPGRKRKAGTGSGGYIKDGKTWSGRGRRPAWVNEIISRGDDLEKYRSGAQEGKK